jgi:hypothetical protein
MPDLIFNIKFNADNIGDIESKLSAIQAKANQSSKSDTKITNEQSKATEQLNQKFKRLVTLNEVRYRQGKTSQAQSLRIAKNIENWALKQDVLNDRTLKGVQAQKTMYLSQQRIETGFKGMATSSATANQSLVNLGRIVQDLPFGFLGISNNIDPMLNSFRQLKEETGSSFGALKALLVSLKGSGGLIFALGSLLPTAVLIAQQGFNMYSKKAKDAEVGTKDVTKALAELRDFGTFSFLGRGSIQREIDTISDMRSALNEIVDARNQYFNSLSGQGDVSSFFQSDSQKALKNTLKELEDQYGFTAKEAKELIDLQENLQKKLDTINTRSSFAELAKYREELEKSIDRTKLFVGTGLESSESLKVFAKIYFDQARELKELGLETADQRVRYELLIKSARDLTKEYESLSDAVVIQKSETRGTLEIYRELSATWDNAKRKAQELKDAQMALVSKIPKAQNADPFNEESRSLNQAELAQQLYVDRQILQAEGLARKKLEVENKYYQKILSLGKQGLLNKEILNQLELNKKQELENQKTELAKQQAEKERAIRQQLSSASFSLASNFLSSLSQLNQAQTDETEVQARKKFEKEKKLQKASALVSGFQAVARQYSDLPLYAAIPASVFTAGITAMQVRAIEKTQFEGGGSSQAPSQTGFFTSESQSNSSGTGSVNQSVVATKPPDQPVYISLDGEFDDEVLSVKAQRGNEKRLRSTYFVVE